MTQMTTTDTALRLAILRRDFPTRWRGYDKAEVDELLGTVVTLAEELVDAADETARNLAEADAELVINRAEARELRDITAATEALLANTRAELKAARQGQAPERDLTAEARLAEAEERLVVAEAELRVLRSAAEGTEWALLEAQDELATERGGRADAERRLADAESKLAASDVHLGELRRELAELRAGGGSGGGVAGTLRAVADTAEADRSQGRQELRRLVDEAARRAALVEPSGADTTD